MRTFLKIKNSRKAVKGGYFKNDSCRKEKNCFKSMV